MNFNFLSNSSLIIQQYGQVVIFIEWHLKIDGLPDLYNQKFDTSCILQLRDLLHDKQF